MASMPAPRAAASTWTRAKCQKSPGYSPSGSKLPSTRAFREADRSPAPKMMASSRGLALAISAALDSPSASSISTSRPMRFGEPELGLELGEQHVVPPDVAGGAGLGDDDDVEGLAGAGDDLDDVAVAPGGVEPVDPDGPHGVAPVLPGEGGHRDRPGADLGRRARRRPRGRGTRGRRRSVAAFMHIFSLLAGVASSERRARGSCTVASSAGWLVGAVGQDCCRWRRSALVR